VELRLTSLLRLNGVHKHNFPVFLFVNFPRALDMMHTYERPFIPLVLKISVLGDVTSCILMHGHYSFDE
jgi:hypothetical protein